jgi:hypothetical protein
MRDKVDGEGGGVVGGRREEVGRGEESGMGEVRTKSERFAGREGGSEGGEEEGDEEDHGQGGWPAEKGNEPEKGWELNMTRRMTKHFG